MPATMNDYAKRKKEIHDHLGTCCAKCGSTENLEIDHVDPKLKSLDVLKNWSISWYKLVEELKKCQLLCSSCHQYKTDTANITHNYCRYLKHKCRCPECKRDYSRWKRAYKDRTGKN